MELDAGGDSPFLGDAACAAVVEQANETPLSLYVVFDKSGSMAGNKWASAKAGLQGFLEDPQSAGIHVAIKFFPRAGNTELCSSTPYMTPDVDFALLPGNAAPIVSAMDNQSPNGVGTPVYPALGGAIRKLEVLGGDAKKEQRAASFAVLLVTDGQPEGPPDSCTGVDPLDTSEAAKLAAKGLQFDPPVRTFVVGLPGVDKPFANAVAAAGGTDQAFLVDPNDVQASFQNALADVRGRALPCEFALPEKVVDKTIAINQVNVVWTHGDTKTTETLPQTTDCAGGGWHYDDPQEPSKILLCPSTCAAIKQDLKAKIDVELGCATIVR